MAVYQTTIIAIIVILSFFGTIGLLFLSVWWLGTYANRMSDVRAALDAESSTSTEEDPTPAV